MKTVPQTHVHTCMSNHAYANTAHTCIHVCKHTCMRANIYLCADTCTHLVVVLVYACILSCKYVCFYVGMQTCVRFSSGGWIRSGGWQDTLRSCLSVFGAQIDDLFFKSKGCKKGNWPLILRVPQPPPDPPKSYDPPNPLFLRVPEFPNP